MIVYALVNEVNGKSYVGQHHGNEVETRWNPSLLRSCPYNPHLVRAVKKYGAAAFRSTILAHASCQQELDLLEQFHILIRQATNPRFGYNTLPGGVLWRGKPSIEMRQKLRLSNWLVWHGMSKARRERHIKAASAHWRDPIKKERLRRRQQLAWDQRTERARQRSLLNLEKGRHCKRGKPAWNKGMTMGRMSMRQRKQTSETMKRFWKQKREAMDMRLVPPRKPVVSEKAVKPVKPEMAVEILREMRRQLRHIELTLKDLKSQFRRRA